MWREHAVMDAMFKKALGQAKSTKANQDRPAPTSAAPPFPNKDPPELHLMLALQRQSVLHQKKMQRKARRLAMEANLASVLEEF